MPPDYITLLMRYKMSPTCSALGRVWDLWFKDFQPRFRLFRAWGLGFRGLGSRVS